MTDFQLIVTALLSGLCVGSVLVLAQSALSGIRR